MSYDYGQPTIDGVWTCCGHQPIQHIPDGCINAYEYDEDGLLTEQGCPCSRMGEGL